MSAPGIMEKWKFFIDTHGCKVNQYESQALAERWSRLGGERCERPEDADYIIINTCAITSHAERDGRNALYKFKRQAPQAKVIYTGCAAQFFQDFKPRKKANWAAPDLCLPQKDKMLLLRGPNLLGEGAEEYSLLSCNRGRPVVKVQDGCSQNCAYCIVPQTRGKPRSATPEQILDQMRRLLASGYSELVISGINLRQYGKDRPEYGDFWQLMSFLDQSLAGEFPHARLRISSLEPSQLSDSSLDILLDLKLVCPHIHLSLQHVAPNILKKMARGHYNGQMILDALAKIRKEWPVFGLGADIIAGFPGEGEAEFGLLLDFVEELPLTYAHVFPFSARQGTVAKNLPGQITRKVKCARAAIIRERVDIKKRKFWRQLLNRELMCVSPDLAPKGNSTIARRGVNEFYVPCFFQWPHSGSGILKAKPQALGDEGLMVSIVG